MFGKNAKHLHGVNDAGTRLLFKFRSGTLDLNEDLGRHGGKEGKLECNLCSVSMRVLWEYSAYT